MKKTWKKWVALGMTFSMMAGIAGCGNSKHAGSENTTEAAKKQEAAAPIKIATKPMTEQFILGEMLKLVIEDTTDYSVELTKGIGGGTNNIMPAMESGDFDLYPEYTSSGYIMVLKHDSDGISDEDMWKQLQKEYKDKYDMSWIGQYGFNNTYALIIREEAAKKYNLTKTSQLADVSDELVFGGNSDYIERNKDIYYDMLTRVRTRNDMIGWIKFFLEAVIETSKTAKEKFRNVVEFTMEMDKTIIELPIKTENAKKVIDLLYDEPVLTRNKMSEITGIKLTTINGIVNALLDKRIITETTGYSRNQIFAFEKYINLFLK